MIRASSRSPTPQTAAAVLSSVGKALTTGFGADAIRDGAQQASFFTKAFVAVDRGSQQVVLVDDDLSTSSSLPDVRPALSAAIQSATGSAPEVIEVPALKDADLSQISGKTVVWATGWASYSDPRTCLGCSDTPRNLTDNDQRTLTAFLNSGGKLILTGQDALTDMGNATFVRDTLKLSVQTNSFQDKKVFNGSPGTAFAAESYSLNNELFSSTPRYTRHDVLVSTNPATVAQGAYPGVPRDWRYLSGTSMAAAHATGVAALVASEYPDLLSDPEGLRKRVMDSGKPAPATAGRTVTGDMVDAEAALLGVAGVSPARSATDASVIANVTATFLSEMDPTTLSTSTFTLTRQGATTPVNANVSYDAAATRTAKLDPSAVLEPGTSYTATIKGGPGGARDEAGNTLVRDYSWTFTTSPPPFVWIYTPTQATGVPRGTRPTATFSSTVMDASTITPTNIRFEVYNKQKKRWIGVAHTVSYDAVSRTATVTPGSLLAASKKYRVTVTTNVRSSTGVALDQDRTTPGDQPKIWTFTTGSS